LSLINQNLKYLKNCSNLILIGFFIIFHVGCKKSGDSFQKDDSLLTGQSAALSDLDGNTYKTVAIGTQVWMAENLKTTKYNDGTSISLVTDDTAWGKLSTPGYCWLNNDAATNKGTYGALYNWHTVNTKKLCPTGWHVPTNDEWTTLFSFLGGGAVASIKLKESGTAHWYSPNIGTNTSGFTALPGSFRYCTGSYAGKFYAIGSEAVWWTSNVKFENSALFWSIGDDNVVWNAFLEEGHGYSVRCMKGEGKVANQAPQQPSSPSPVNDATKISTSTTFSWTSSDPELDPLTYDVYLGVSSNPTTKVGSDLIVNNYSPAGLSAGVQYYWKIVAKDNKNNSKTGPVWTFTTAGTTPGGIYDADGNAYSSVTIGTQVWLTSNLRTTKYNDGTAIPLVTDNTAWKNLSTPGYCWYDNNAAANMGTYGALYNWYTLNTKKLCPAGWHVPSDAEWTTLSSSLGGEMIAGAKLKETGTTHWSSPNTATNTTGFTALPGGGRYDNGTFYNHGVYTAIWSSTETGTNSAWYRKMSFNAGDIVRYDNLKASGKSVRCLKD